MKISEVSKLKLLSIFSLNVTLTLHAMAAESNGGCEVEDVLPRSGHIAVAAKNYMITWGGYQVCIVTPTVFSNSTFLLSFYKNGVSSPLEI